QLFHGAGDEHRTENEFSSHRDHADRFRLDAQDPAHAVRCIREGKLVVTSDCLAAAAASVFTLYDDSQKVRLRSIAAYPVKEVVNPKGLPVPASLVLDTDIPGFFPGDDCDLTKLCCASFAERLSLEMVLLALSVERGNGS